MFEILVRRASCPMELQKVTQTAHSARAFAVRLGTTPDCIASFARQKSRRKSSPIEGGKAAKARSVGKWS